MTIRRVASFSLINLRVNRTSNSHPLVLRERGTRSASAVVAVRFRRPRRQTDKTSPTASTHYINSNFSVEVQETKLRIILVNKRMICLLHLGRHMEEKEEPELEEIIKQNYFTYLEYCRSMMIDKPDSSDEYPFLGFTLRRTDSENNIWDILAEQDDKKPILINSIDVSHFETANSLLNKIAEEAGVEFEDDDSDMTPNQPESTAFR